MDSDVNGGCFALFFVFATLLGIAWLGFCVWVIIELVTWITSK